MTLDTQLKVENLLNNGTTDWRSAAGNELLSILRPPSDFPCFFSQFSCQRRNILFAFVEDLGERSLRQAAEDLEAYVELSKNWDGEVATAKPLVMLFNPASVSAPDVEGYHAIGWRVLRFWHEVDPAPWPEGVAVDADSPYWSMCFAGMQLFVNMSCPAHKVRRSRNLGRAFTFVINPRERFDMVAGDNPAGRKIRGQIRRRIKAYDGLEHSPHLGSYQAGELEWPQYGLAEHNGSLEGRCPFQVRMRGDARK